jgi:hypothetical protein
MFHGGLLNARVHMTDPEENLAFMSAIKPASRVDVEGLQKRPHAEVSFYWLNWYYDAVATDPKGLQRLDPNGPFSNQARYYPAHGRESALIVFEKPIGRGVRYLNVTADGLEILSRHHVPVRMSRQSIETSR